MFLSNRARGLVFAFSPGGQICNTQRINTPNAEHFQWLRGWKCEECVMQPKVRTPVKPIYKLIALIIVGHRLSTHTQSPKKKTHFTGINKSHPLILSQKQWINFHGFIQTQLYIVLSVMQSFWLISMACRRLSLVSRAMIYLRHIGILFASRAYDIFVFCRQTKSV